MTNALTTTNQNDDRLTLRARFDRSFVWTRGNSVRYLLVDVQAPDPELAEGAVRRPLNLALVIDRSSSMNGAPFAAAKQAAEGVVESLSPSDHLSLVSFCQRVDVHATSVRMDEQGKAELRRAIADLDSEGMTNLSGGWLEGARCVASRMEAAPNSHHRVVLLSDGYANEGIVKPEQLAQHARESRSRGLYTSTVGIGDNYSTVQIQTIAEHGGGRLHDAERPEEIIEVVVAELREILTTAAEDVSISLSYPPQVQVEALGTYAVVTDTSGTACSIGPMMGGATRQVVFKTQAPSGKRGTGLEFNVYASWKKPGDNSVLRTDGLEIALTYAPAAVNTDQKRDIPVSQDIAKIWQSFILQQVAIMNQEHRLDEASDFILSQLEFFGPYCEGLPGTSSLVEELRRAASVSRQQWNPRSSREIYLRHHHRSRRQADHRSAARPSWDDYLPEPGSGSKPGDRPSPRPNV